MTTMVEELADDQDGEASLAEVSDDEDDSVDVNNFASTETET